MGLGRNVHLPHGIFFAAQRLRHDGTSQLKPLRSRPALCEDERAPQAGRLNNAAIQNRRGIGYKFRYMGLTTILMLLIPLGYLMGSIPFGLLVGLAKGKDPRLHGSGNIGAPTSDAFSAPAISCWSFSWTHSRGRFPRARGRPLGPCPGPVAQLASLSAVADLGICRRVGNMFCPFLHFKGGKGVATSFGVALGLFPYLTLPGLIGIAVWGIVLAAKRYVSLASITAAVAFLAAYVGIGLLCHWHPFGQQWPLLMFALVVVVILILRHGGNIARLLAGTEHRIGHKKKVDSAAPVVVGESAAARLGLAEVRPRGRGCCPAYWGFELPSHAAGAAISLRRSLGPKNRQRFCLDHGPETLATKAVNFVGTIVLAWWLSKSDFALAAKAPALVVFANLIQEAGLQQVLIHRQAEFARWANGAFWMSLATGLLGMTVMLLLAYPAEIFFHAPRLGALIIVLAIRRAVPGPGHGPQRPIAKPTAPSNF